MPRGDHVLNFSDAEELLTDEDLKDAKDDLVEHAYIRFFFSCGSQSKLMPNRSYQQTVQPLIRQLLQQLSDLGLTLSVEELAIADRRNKKEIRNLEQELPKWQVLVDSVTGISPPDFDNQTLAVLRGRLVRYLMRSREITLGRATNDNQIDVDLSLEGPVWKISRRQGAIKLRSNGDFYIANEGKRPIYIDGKPILTGNKQRLNNNSVVEVLWLIVEEVVETTEGIRAKLAEEAEKKATADERNAEIRPLVRLLQFAAKLAQRLRLESQQAKLSVVWNCPGRGSQITFNEERDIDLTVDINTGHVGTSDFKLEPEDREFIIQQGRRSTETFLRYYVVQNNDKTKDQLASESSEASQQPNEESSEQPALNGNITFVQTEVHQTPANGNVNKKTFADMKDNQVSDSDKGVEHVASVEVTGECSKETDDQVNSLEDPADESEKLIGDMPTVALIAKDTEKT